MSKEVGNTQTSGTLKNLLVAFEMGGVSDIAMEKAILLAQKFQSHIWMLHIAEGEPEFVGYGVGPESTRSTVAEHLHTVHREFQDVAHEFRSRYEKITPIVAQGDVVEKLLEQIKKTKADLVLVSPGKKHFMAQVFKESVSQELAKRADTSVLICH